MASAPLLNFQAYNPVDTAINAALGVYGGITQGQATRQQTAINKELAPYQIQNAQSTAQINAVNAEYARPQAEAALASQQMAIQQKQMEDEKLKIALAREKYYRDKGANSEAQREYVDAMDLQAFAQQYNQPQQQQAAPKNDLFGNKMQAPTAPMNNQVAPGMNQPINQPVSAPMQQQNQLPGGATLQNASYSPNMQIAQNLRTGTGNTPEENVEAVEQTVVKGPAWELYMPQPKQQSQNPADLMLQKSMEKYTPEDVKAGKKSAAMEAAKLEAQNMDKRNAELTADAKTIGLTDANLARLNATTDLLKDSDWGRIYGRIPPGANTAPHVYDTAVRNLQKQLIESLRGTGAVSKGDLDLLEMMLPNRTMTPAARKEALGYFEALNNRMKERQEFYQTGWDNGVATYELDKGWNKYNINNPFIKEEDVERVIGMGKKPTKEEAIAEINKRKSAEGTM